MCSLSSQPTPLSCSYVHDVLRLWPPNSDLAAKRAGGFWSPLRSVGVPLHPLWPLALREFYTPLGGERHPSYPLRLTAETHSDTRLYPCRPGGGTHV